MTQKTTDLVAEFKKFIARGNVMDIAVGMIVGGASKPIADFVNDFIMPSVSLTTGNVLFSKMTWVVGDNLTVTPYGNFLAAVLSSLIAAFFVFFLVKAMNCFYKKEEKTSATPPAPGREETLLKTIRDFLKERRA